ncbi:thymidylate kinase [Candidatus Sumerlaeota bacterium]|nr:thymidylate kinase [Candidatus Sumerlaeota bacterium]
MSPTRFYGNPPPGVKASELKGKLIVLEGADGSGRSTQIRSLTEWLERAGHATVNIGLKRSTLVSRELERAKRGNILGNTTMSLFYATDFADQLENVMIPALRAGYVVLADRYIYTLMVRDIVRGADRAWVESIYGIAPAPDLIFYLRVSPRNLVERNLEKNQTLDYWESGMDIALSRDMFESFIAYQKMVRREFLILEKQFGFQSIDANRSPSAVTGTIRKQVAALFGGKMNVDAP